MQKSKLMFGRHFIEMVAVMFIGMGVFAGIAALALNATGGSFADYSAELRVAFMGVSMVLPMVAWMSYRGHTRAQNVEMAMSMTIPTVITAVLAAVGTFGAATALEVQHIVMVPAMLGVMLWRYDEYAKICPRDDLEARQGAAARGAHPC
jgi:hypothetical protein